MQRFRSYIAEGKYPLWVRVTVASMVLKLRKLSVQISQEKDPVEQNKLIAQQNKLISYATGLGVAIGTNDKSLLRKMKAEK